MLTVIFSSSPDVHLPIPADRVPMAGPQSPPTVIRALCGTTGISKTVERNVYNCPHCRVVNGDKVSGKAKKRLNKEEQKLLREARQRRQADHRTRQIQKG